MGLKKYGKKIQSAFCPLPILQKQKADKFNVKQRFFLLGSRKSLELQGMKKIFPKKQKNLRNTLTKRIKSSIIPMF